ncbi:PREDICTED: uncharacterized protein LOC104748414, partial [Camelina sativa]|uniref:Uncharacterized protein LOC104748414 n=1 Tax=Camelina sativa TaxID=90675 RepID=A0ABM1QZ72_CAMSA
ATVYDTKIRGKSLTSIGETSAGQREHLFGICTCNKRPFDPGGAKSLCELGRVLRLIEKLHKLFIGSKLQTGDEMQGKRLLDFYEKSLLDSDKVDLTITESWFYNTPMIRRVFQLQRPPELINLHGNSNLITMIMKELIAMVILYPPPPDQFSQAFMGKYSCFHP